MSGDSYSSFMYFIVSLFKRSEERWAKHVARVTRITKLFEGFIEQRLKEEKNREVWT
jgi:hypothetical protein